MGYFHKQPIPKHLKPKKPFYETKTHILSQYNVVVDVTGHTATQLVIVNE